MPVLYEISDKIRNDGKCKGLSSFWKNAKAFYPKSCDNNGTSFVPILHENLKQVQIDDIKKRYPVLQHGVSLR